MLFSTIKPSLNGSQPFSAVEKEMFSQRNRTKTRKKSYHIYNYGTAGVEWKLLPRFLIILNCIEKGVLILAKLSQYRFQYNIILNVLSDHVIVIHHSLDRISFSLKRIYTLFAHKALPGFALRTVGQRASAMLLDFTIDMASRYIKKRKSIKKKNNNNNNKTKN